jgi:taste receptor type 2|uniref:Taste receptor type 2 n=1 Tax=Castor canadensis TaxID=51338 RepID=A0A8B7THD4_CASCN|nr:taste receptor type 2 member 19-like [Castor canadensis]
MISFLQSIIAITTIAEFVLGNFGNVFIALVNCLDWVKRQKISSTDQILTALAVSRIGLLWVIFIYWYSIVFNLAVYYSQIKPNLFIAWSVTNHFSTWLATILTICYFLKIANFSNITFLHLKKRVKRVIVVVLLGTLVLLFPNLVMISIHEIMLVNEYEGNVTWKVKLQDIVELSNLTVFTLVNLIPVFISLMCFLLLIYSLCKHLRMMKLHGKGFHDPSTAVHIKVLQTVISFLLLFTIYSLCIMIPSWNSHKPSSEWLDLFFQNIGLLYPSSHSYVLIWRNKKLRQAFLSVLGQVRFWLKEWNPSRL